MKVFKIIGLLLAAGISGAVSCACSKGAGEEIRNKEDVVDIPETDEDSDPDLTVEEI